MVRAFNKLFLFFYAFLLFVTPLIMFSKTSELFEFNKILFIYLITSIILSLWIGKTLIFKKIIIKKTTFNIPVFLFLLSQVFSTLFSIDRHTSIFGYYGRFNGGLLSIVSYIILFFGFISNIEGMNIVNFLTSLLKISLISSMIVILWGIPGKFGYDLTCFLFTGNLNNNCWTEQFKPSERMFSTLGQPNWLGAYLAINFFIGLYFFWRNKGLNLLAGYLLINFSAILFTRSRSALLAVVVGLILFVLLDLFLLSKKIELKKYLWFSILVFIPIFFFKTGVPTIDKFFNPDFYFKSAASLFSHQNRLTSKKNPVNENQSLAFSNKVTDSGEIRKIVWRGAINLGIRYPLFGTGVETFGYSYYFVRPKEHNLTSEWDFIYNKAHNEFLNYLATTGFIGLGTYLLMVGVVIIEIFKQLLNSKNLTSKNSLKITDASNYQLLITCFFLAYLTILITNFFGFSTTTINLYFYLIPAFLVLLFQPKATVNNQVVNRTLSPVQKIQLVIPLTVFLGGFVFCLNYFLADINYALGNNYRAVQDYSRAYFYLNKALSYKNEHVYQDKLSTVLANLAFILYYKKNNDKEVNQLIKLSKMYNLKSLTQSPKNVLYWKTQAKDYYLFYQINSNREELKKAIKALEVSKTLAPTDPKIYYSLAMLYLADASQQPKKPSFDKALVAINKAVELKPNFRDGYYGKGLILKQLGRKKEAKDAFQYILKKLNPNDEEAEKEINNL